uniref:Tafazzin family protein n=1 Tax=Calcidiscus leptoporus TaxID=127549 RepID=A0A7S0J2L1_9EUKA|mmetsp:Transcript_35539/g.82981  ORF Transcript_35539/g.82981 Transcript_35539/m.82981 type:complete len:288 (+) Transcript_35539:68-931(+)
MFGAARRLALGVSAAAAAAAYVDDDIRRTLTIAIGGGACRAFLTGTNTLTVHEHHHLQASLARPAGTALLSISNHTATIDDPHLIASIVPKTTLMRGASEMRWGVCGHDVCFREGSVLRRFADAAKVLPIRRGGGIWQPELDAIIGKLKSGGWVHYFPEGKIRQDQRIHPFRRGVGRLVASVPDAEKLQVLPFYFMGTDVIQPTTPQSSSLFSWPTLGSEVHVIFGPPVPLSHLLVLRDLPPFNKRPELLYEVIAHTLEEEVRGLRMELYRRLGRSIADIPPEGGAF